VLTGGGFTLPDSSITVLRSSPLGGGFPAWQVAVERDAGATPEFVSYSVHIICADPAA
jgi:hypothetical protein